MGSIFSGTDYFSHKKNLQVHSRKHFPYQLYIYCSSFSLVLIAVCDAYYKFVMVDIGAQDLCMTVQYLWSLPLEMLSWMMNFLNPPPAKELPGANIKLPHYIVANQAFPLHEKIIRPYSRDNLGNEKIIFNYRISRASRIIENSFWNSCSTFNV